MPLRIHSVLAAYEGGPGADAVLRSARALARLAEAELHVVHAIEPGAGVPRRGRPAIEAETRAEREATRTRILAALEAAEPATSCEVLEGEASAVILDRSRMVAADLIVIGAHRGTEPGGSFGTTADRVVRQSPAPCLVVHSLPDLPLRRVVVATDLSEGAGHALEVAMTWTSLLRVPALSGGGTELIALHVTAGDGDLDATRLALDGHVAHAIETTGVAAMLEVRSEVLGSGDPAGAIVRAGRDMDASLVVLGTRDHAPRADDALGSVSSAVVRTATTPVLLVPPQAAG